MFSRFDPKFMKDNTDTCHYFTGLSWIVFDIVCLQVYYTILKITLHKYSTSKSSPQGPFNYYVRINWVVFWPPLPPLLFALVRFLDTSLSPPPPLANILFSILAQTPSLHFSHLFRAGVLIWAIICGICWENENIINFALIEKSTTKSKLYKYIQLLLTWTRCGV